MTSSVSKPTTIDVFPHFVDFSLAFIRYQNEIENQEIISLLNSLRSNLPLKRVDCLGLKSSRLAGLITLFEILSINNSVIDLDISPSFVGVDNGLFCYSPESFTQLTTDDVVSLRCFLTSFKIQELIFKKTAGLRAKQSKF
ncbi:hypothetical protein GEMRC1_005870 [Eukaryota sp. GEM-RC1]